MLINRADYKQILLTLLILISGNVAALEKEAVIKAGFLFNFARYAQWSEEQAKSNSFMFCTPDARFLKTAAKVLQGQKVNGLPIKHALVAFTADELNPCQLLFVTTPFAQQWAQLDDYKFHNMMVIGESEGFIEQGGHIRFFLSGGKIRFEVSQNKLIHSGITMSSKVLRLGRVLDN